MTNDTDRLAILEARINQLTQDLEHLQRSTAQEAPEPEDDQDSNYELLFGTLEEFVDGFVLDNYPRPAMAPNELVWYQCWRNHPAIDFSLIVLWASFEQACAADERSGGGNERTDWMLGRFIPLMDWMTGPTGPLRLCSVNHCAGHRQLGHLSQDPTTEIPIHAIQ